MRRHGGRGQCVEIFCECLLWTAPNGGVPLAIFCLRQRLRQMLANDLIINTA